ncbi:MAG: hypothetical protein J6333_08225, partial [Planctomycetes bacterium]|nr:hypothetical protein [Planctomycetota bacterium]
MRIATLSLLLAAFFIAALPQDLRAAEAPATAPGGAGSWKTAPAPTGDDDWRGKTVVIPLSGPIGPRALGGTEEAFVAAVKKAEGAKRVIVAIDSPGGLVDSCDLMAQALLRCPAPTMALVLHKAVSGGAMIATACREIHMVAGSRIGDVQPMNFAASRMDERTAEKIEADVRAMMAVNAARNGYPKALLEAMVSRDNEVYELRFSDGRREFLDGPAYRLFNENQKAGRDHRELAAPPKLVSRKGQLLAVDAAAAVALGLAKTMPESEEAFLRSLGAAPEEIVRAPLPKSDLAEGLLANFSLSRWVVVALVAFLVIGVAGTLTEMHAPGFGLPGAAGIIGFACFFYLLISHGRAEWYEIALFVMGIILMVVEIVVLPGFGVCGVLGGIFLIAGLVLSLLPDLESDYMKANLWEEASFALILGLGVLVGGAALFIWLVNRAGKLPLGRQAFLEDTLPDYATAMRAAPGESKPDAGAGARGEALVGQAATAATDLRPAGKIAMADGSELDAVSAGEF